MMTIPNWIEQKNSVLYKAKITKAFGLGRKNRNKPTYYCILSKHRNITIYLSFSGPPIEFSNTIFRYFDDSSWYPLYYMDNSLMCLKWIRWRVNRNDLGCPVYRLIDEIICTPYIFSYVSQKSNISRIIFQCKSVT